MAAGEEAEHHGRPEGAARPAVGHAERRAHGVAGGIEPVDRVAVEVEHPGVGIDPRSALGAQGATVDLEGVVRPPLERAEGGVAPTLAIRVTPPAVERTVTSAEVGVVAFGAQSVPAVDRALQLLTVDPKRGCQLAGGVAPRYPIGHLPAIPSGRDPKAVGIDIGLIKDEPARQVGVLELGHILDVERGAEGVVVGGLIGEPPPPSVDHDRVRQRALTVDEDAAHRIRVRRHHADRNPPRLAHVRDHRPGPHGHDQAVTGVRLHRHGMGHRPAQEAATQFLVPLEPASGDDHPPVGTQLDLPVRRVDHHSDHRSAVEQEAASGAGRLRFDPPIETRPQQPAGQRLAAPSLVAQTAALQLLGRRRLGNGLAERRFAHRDPGIGEVRRRCHPGRPLAEIIEGKDRTLQRPPAARAATGELRVIVGHAGHGVELNGSLRLQLIHHLRPGVDECLHEALFEQPTRQRHDVRHGVLAAVGNPDVGHVRVVRDPHLATRPGCGTSHEIGLLDHPDARATVMRRNRRRQTSRTRPQDDHVISLHDDPPSVEIFHGAASNDATSSSNWTLLRL